MAINSKGRLLNKMDAQVNQVTVEDSDPPNTNPLYQTSSSKETDDLLNLRLEIASYQK